MSSFVLSIPQSLRTLLETPQQVVIITHQNPDGDAIGSSMGLCNMLLKKGHQVHVVVPNEYPVYLRWMQHNELILDFIRQKKSASQLICSASLVFFVDFNSIKRMDEISKVLDCSNAVRVLIDHHPYPQIKVDYAFSYINVSSTCELICDFFREMGWLPELDKNIAECLLTGIMTDTGCFMHASSSAATFINVAELLAVGADKDRIYNSVFNNYSYHRMRLMGYCLSQKLVYLPHYKTAYMSLTKEELDRFQFETGDTEGFVNIPFSIRGVVVTALFVEKRDFIKISFRSKGDYAINAFSEKYFGGGGHKNAAGGESRISMDETLTKFQQLIAQHAQEILAASID